MMGVGGRRKYCALGWEQWWLGWNTITYDLSNSTQNGWYTLTDFVSTGKMMRIQIPNTNQHLWLEFHNGSTVFDDRVIFTGSFPESPTGVYAYVENMPKNKYSPSIFTPGANGIKFLHGNGNKDFQASYNCTVSPEWYNNCVYDYTDLEENPFSSHNGFAYIRSDLDHNNQIKYTPAANAPGWAGGNEMDDIKKRNGLFTYDLFGAGTPLLANTSYSIGSNPAIIDHQIYNESTQSLSSINLHGLKIIVGSITSTTAQIYIQYNYNKVDNDTRWTGNIDLPVNQPITIDGATVTIDRSGTPSREYPDPVFGFYPYSNFSLKDGSILEIINNGSLILDENTTMYLNEGSDFNVISGSFEIKSGSSLIVNSGNYNIANNGVITINGNITLKENANVTISGSGYIVLNGTISAEPGASLTIGGVGNTTKLLEVQKSISFDTDFANVTIRNGKVVMNNSTSELYFNNGIDNITLDNIWVTSATGTTNNSHQGVDIRSNGNITVTNSTFELGNYGLYASRGATSPNLNISNCTFKYCDYGLRVYNGGITVDGCTFENNITRGIYCTSMDLAGSVENTTIRYQSGSSDYGLTYEGSSTARLSLNGNTITNNYYGVYVTGSFVSSYSCNFISNNTNWGVYGVNNSMYFANGTGISGGNNEMNSNLYAIQVSGTSLLYLNNGYNDLRSTSYCLYGSMTGYTPTTMAANNNYWKTGGGTPVINVNYQLTGANGAITVTDNSPESAFYLCETPGDLLEGTATTETTDASATYRTVTTDLGTLPLNETVEATLNSDTESGTVFDNETQFNLIAQTLNNNLAALTTAEEKQATHTYRMFRSNLGKQIAEKGTVDAVQIDNMLQVIEKLKADEKQSHGKKAPKKHTARYFALSMDEAQTLWLKQEYAGAITLLQELTAKATDDQLCEIQRMICQIEISRDITNSDNTLEIEEQLMQCSECSGSEKSGSIYSTGNGQQMVEQANLLGTDISLSVIPHPVTGNSEILVKGLAEPATLTVYNSLGAVVLQRDVPDENSAIKITRNELEPGMYLITLNQNGATLQTLKMVVQ